MTGLPPYAMDPAAPLPERIKGLIFDCDGTLIDTMPIHFQAWTKVAVRHGLAFSEEKFYSLAGMPTAKIVETLCGEQGKTLDAEAVAHEKEVVFVEMMSAAEPIHCVIGVARREQRRRKLAVASGGWRRVVLNSLRTIGCEDLFDTVVGADEVAHGKPHPDMFLEAARRLGVRPQECVVYEDGEFGFQAARAAGMEVVDVRPWYLPRKTS